MDSGSIGIKLADNKFFPIMEDGVEGGKTLELTTVSENQQSVQIHLYRSGDSSHGQTVDGAQYIGTLIIEDIAKKPAGSPTIKLKIAINGAGDLSAEAQDMDSGTHQSLNVSLKDLSREMPDPLADFDITGIESEDFALSGLDDIDLDIEDCPDAEGGADSFLQDASFDDSSYIKGDSFSNAESFSGGAPAAASPDFDDMESLAHSVPESLYDSSDVKARRGVFIPAWACILILVVGIALLAAALVFAWRLFIADTESRQAPAAAVRPAAASELDPSLPDAAPQAGAIAPSAAPSTQASPAARTPSEATQADSASIPPAALQEPSSMPPDEAASEGQDEMPAAVAAQDGLPPSPYAMAQADPQAEAAPQDAPSATATSSSQAGSGASPALQANPQAGATPQDAPSATATSSSQAGSGASPALQQDSRISPAAPSQIARREDLDATDAVSPPSSMLDSANEPPTPPPVWQENAAVVEAEPEPPAPPPPAPAAEPVRYMIRWGDTLWDIAETYYRNPWMYARIAEHNGIRDPNLIIAGTYLTIPAR